MENDPTDYSEDICNHHPWCSFFLRPSRGCDMCKRLFREYPLKGMTPREMATKYFPDAIVKEHLDD